MIEAPLDRKRQRMTPASSDSRLPTPDSPPSRTRRSSASTSRRAKAGRPSELVAHRQLERPRRMPVEARQVQRRVDALRTGVPLREGAGVEDVEDAEAALEAVAPELD